MKRYAILAEGQLIFNETDNWFDKNKVQWVEQKSEQWRTIEAFEKKYGVRIEWQHGRGFMIVKEAQ